MKVPKILALIAMVKLFTSCGLADISSGDFKDQRSQWLLPIFNSQISVESISQLADLKFTRDVDFARLPTVLQKFTGPIPQYDTTNRWTIGPLPLEDDSNFYVKAKSDTAVLRVIFYNNFPFDIGQGTVVEIYNRRPLDGETTKKLIYRKVITKAIKAKEVDSVEIKENRLLGWIDNDFDIYLKNFSTPGTISNTGFDLNKPMKIVFKLIVLKINVVELNQNKTYNLSDVSSLELDGGDNIKTDLANFNLYIKNGFPADYNIQAYFLAEDKKTILDSLIKGNTRISSPDIDWQPLASNIIPSSVKEIVYSTDWSKEEYSRLKPKVKYLRTEGKFTTTTKAGNTSVINLRHENKIGVSLTGKFDVVYDLKN